MPPLASLALRRTAAAFSPVITRRAVIGVFFLALAVRLIFFFLVAHQGVDAFFIHSDGNEYITVARNLLAGHGFSYESVPPYEPYTYYVPGYPYLIAATLFLGVGARAIVLLQVLLGALMSALLVVFGGRVVGRREAVIGGLLLAIEPTTIFWTNQMVTESISTFFLLIALFLVLAAMRHGRMSRFALAGVALGLSVLVRHAAQFLIVLIPLFIVTVRHISFKRALVGALLFGSVASACLVPWIVRNRMTFGVTFYSTAGGALGVGKTLQSYALQTTGKDLSQLYADEPELGPARYPGEFVIVRYSKFYPRLALRMLAEDPIGLTRFWLSGLIPFFLGDGYTQIRTVLSPGGTGEVNWDGNINKLLPLVLERPDTLAFLFGKAIWIVLLAAALVGARKTFFGTRQARIATLLLLAIISYYGLASGPAGYSRFRYPVTPFLLLFSGTGFVAIFDDLMRRRKKSLDRPPLRRIVVVTQQVDRNHSDLGFFLEWIRAFAERVPQVEVVALAQGEHDLPAVVTVRVPPPHLGRFTRRLWVTLSLWRAISRSQAVFYHMCPEYALVGAPAVLLFARPSVLWFTHRSVNWRLRLAARLVDRVYTAAKEGCRLASGNVMVVGHGIVVPSEVVVPSASATLRLLYAGRISPIKHIEDIVRAVALLQERGIAASLTCVGGMHMPGDEQYKTSLLALAERLGVGDRIRLLGPLAQQHLFAQYQDHDVLVNASPNGPDKVVYEAAAAGLPVMAALPSFVPFFDKHAVTLSFALNEPTTLADRLTVFAGLSAEQRALVGWDLRDQVIAHHSLPQLIDRIVAYLRSVT